MSNLRTELIKSNNAELNNMLLHSSGDLMATPWYGYEHLVMLIYSILGWDSPYHDIPSAQRIEEIVSKELQDMNQDYRSHALENLSVLEVQFIKHSKEASWPKIEAAFDRARVWIQNEQPQRIEPAPEYDRVVDFEKQFFAGCPNHVSIDDLEKKYYHGIPKNEVEAVRLDLSKRGLKELEGQYGAHIIKDVIGVFRYERIQKGRELLDLKSDAPDAGQALHFRLRIAVENKERRIKITNEIFLERMRKAYSPEVVEMVIGEEMTPDQLMNKKLIDQGMFEQLCIRHRQKIDKGREDHVFLHDSIFSKGFIDQMFTKHFEGEGREKFDQGLLTIPKVAIQDGVLKKGRDLKGEIESKLHTGDSNYLMQRTALALPRFIGWVRTVFNEETANLIIYDAFEELGRSPSDCRKATQLTDKSPYEDYPGVSGQKATQQDPMAAFLKVVEQRIK